MPCLKFPAVFKTLVLSILLVALSAMPAFAIGIMPTREKLFTLVTPHFRIIYQEPLADAAPRMARYAEEAYAILTEVYAWAPQEKIDLLFVDSLDTHNGWATAIPHDTFLIYAADAEQGSSIYQPPDYLRRTVFHELTHVLTLDRRAGYNRFLSGVFGKILPLGDPLSSGLFLFTASPVALAPDWYLEGQAIWAETAFAPPGRGGSTFADMVFRCAVRDQNLLPYSKWYLEIPHWPYGLGAYLYGMRLIQHVDASGKQENPPGELNTEISRSVLFANSRAARRATGRSFPALARETLRQETLVQGRDLDALSRNPITPAPRLTPKGMAVGPLAARGDTIYFLADEEEETSRLYAYDPARRAVSRTASAETASPMGSLAVSRADGMVYYTRLNVQDFDNTWYEIRRFDPRTGDALVTDQGRYRSIDISPDGRKIVAVSQRGGRSFLLELALDRNGKFAGERTLLALPPQSELASPRYSPDGSRISYVKAGADGFRLQLRDLGSGAERTLFATSSQLIAPCWHPAGKSLVFASDRNGVFNLYEIGTEQGAAPAPLTNVTGGLFFPVFSADGRRLFATGYDGFGPHLTEVPYPAAVAGPLPVISPIQAEGGNAAWLQALQSRSAAAGGAATANLQAPHRYNSFSGIRFDYWSPWLTASAEGVQGGIGASFSDPTGFQDLKILAGAESRYGTPLGTVQYTYRGFVPNLRVYAAAEQDFFPDLLTDGMGSRFDYAEAVRRYGLSLELPLEKLDRRVTVETGYEYKDRSPIDEVQDDYRGRTLTVAPSEQSEGLVWARVNYFDGHEYGRSSSVEDGRLISLGGEWANKTLGGGLDRSRYLASWNEYLPLPWRKNHVLKLFAAYGFGTGDRIAQGSFGLGGYAQPVAQLTPGLPDTLTLRGYTTNFQVGDKVATVGAAYRFPIWDFSRGKEGIFPFYSRQLSAEIFYEGGRTWNANGSGEERGWINAAGAEVNFAMKMLRYLAIAPGVGVAFAPDRDDAETVQPYFTVKGWVNF